MNRHAYKQARKRKIQDSLEFFQDLSCSPQRGIFPKFPGLHLFISQHGKKYAEHGTLFQEKEKILSG